MKIRHRAFQSPAVKMATKLLTNGLLLAAALALGSPGSARAQVILQDIGATAPTPGPDDIAQLNTSTQLAPDGLNYYYDNGNAPGQTFTTGSNPSGYTLTSLSLKTAGNGNNWTGANSYTLRLFSVSGAAATLIATYDVTGFGFPNQGDWLQWTNLGTFLSPNKQYAYGFRKTAGSGWEAMGVAGSNPYAGGEIMLVPPAGGNMTFGSSHAFDASFVAGLTTAALPPVFTVEPGPAALYTGRTATFAGTVSGTPPFTYRWQKNGVNLSDGGNISGSATNALTVSNVSAADVASYALVVANAAATVTSSVVSLSLVSAPIAGSFAEAVMTNQPLAYWRLGEVGDTNAFDYAGCRNGVYLSAAQTGTAGPQSPDYLGFESTNVGFAPQALDQSWVTVPALNLNTNTVTFVAWIYPYSDQNDWAGIITCRANGTQAGFNFTSTKNELAYTWNNNTTWQYHTGLIIPNNVWSMVALVVSPTNATFYAADANSGIRTAVITLANNSEVWAGPATIGEDEGFGASRAMYGIVDEVAVFKRSLPPTAITALYAAGRSAGMLAPSIVQAPVPQNLYPGRTARFNVAASGTPPLTYHWRKGGVNLTDGGRITGSGTEALAITSVQASDAADYDVVVSNPGGSVTSSVAPLALTAPTGKAYEAAVVAAAPTAYWRLNESAGSLNAFDYYGGNTATYGSSLSAGQTGPNDTEFTGFESYNPAPYFYANSPGSWVVAPPLNLNTNTVTITAWINPVSVQSNFTALVYQRQGLTVAGLAYSSDGLNLGYNWNNSAGAYNWNSGLAVPQDQWSFVAMVVEPSKATLYVYNTNGQKSAANIFTHVVQPFAGNTYIGQDVNSADGSRIFNGLIDEVTIWNRSLTGEQISALYTAASGKVVPPSISLQPAAQTTYVGLNAQFAVSAVGSPTLSYRWLKGGAPLSDGGSLSGAATPTLNLTGVTTADAGQYSVIVTNTSGSVTSVVATLTVLPSSARIVWSAPAAITTADTALTQAGTVVGAAAFGGTAATVTLGSGLVLNFTADGSVATTTGNGTGSGALVLKTTGNANFDSVLGRYNYDGGPKTITLNSLLPGHQYTVQLFGLDNRDSSADGSHLEESRRAFYRDPYDTNDYTPTFYMSNNVYVVGTFTAAATNQLVTMVLPGYDDGVTQLGNGNLNVLVIRDQSAAPMIQTQPASLTRFQGTAAAITASAYGAPPVHYRWQKSTGGAFTDTSFAGTIAVAAITTVSASFPSVVAADAGDYRLVVTNSAGSATSQVATLTVTVPAPNSYTANVIANGPLAYYRLNEKGSAAAGTLVARDYAGGHDGVFGSFATNGVPGPLSPAFTGFETDNTAVQTAITMTNSWVTAPFGSLSTNTVTFTAWIYPMGVQTGWAGLLVTRGGGTEGSLNFNDQSMLGYAWNNNSTWGFTSGLVIPSELWSFVALVVEPTQATLYLYNANGQLSATNAIAHTSDVFGGNWLIGADGTGGGRVFNGVMDEVAVYTKSLTYDQIGQLYSSAVSAPVTLNIQAVSGGVQLTWPQGTLLQANTVSGPWTTNTATSPYLVTPAVGNKFYRVQVR